jgi:prepilin-type N-terminal cleavage/methylation domain-containing protein
MISLIGVTKKNNAFTFIEILLVIVIIGIIVALASPNFSKGYSRFQLNKTADDLLEHCRWAQAMAIGQERIYALSFSGDHRSYKLERVKRGEGNDDQGSFEPVNGGLGRMHAVPDAILLDTKDDRIKFYPDGTIDPETIQLGSSEQKIVLSSGQVRGMMMKVDNE